MATLAASLGGCTPVAIPDAALMPRDLSGAPVLSDEGAMWFASYALAVPSRTRDDPASGARAAASIEYLASALYRNPRWDYVSAVAKSRMVDGRAEVRSALGIDPHAPSQAVVDHLLAVAAASQGGDQPAAGRALSAPEFTLGPDRTLALLANLPYLQLANVAAQRAAAESVPPFSRCRRLTCF